jgi:Ca2+/Na+ antiporter
MKIFDKYKNQQRKERSFFLLLFIVVFTIVIWILVLNHLFNPLLAMILMILMIVIVRLDMKNKEKEENEKLKWVRIIRLHIEEWRGVFRTGFSSVKKEKYKNFLNFIEDNDETNIRNVI